MRRPLRLALVVGGLSALFFGAALITGGWLGVPTHYGIRHVREGDAIRQVYPERGLSTEYREMLLGFGLAMVGGTLALILAWRPTFVVVGLAIAVYGFASLTGGWLGTPPWWETEEWISVRMPSELQAEAEERIRRDPNTLRASASVRHPSPRSGREWISGAVVVGGLGLAAIGARPRRRRSESAT